MNWKRPTALATAAAAIALFAIVGVGSAAQASGTTVNGCPSGSVCSYSSVITRLLGLPAEQISAASLSGTTTVDLDASLLGVVLNNSGVDVDIVAVDGPTFASVRLGTPIAIVDTNISDLGGITLDSVVSLVGTDVTLTLQAH